MVPSPTQMEFDGTMRLVIPWPEPFDDGDVHEFIMDFEDIAEVNGVETEKAKVRILHSLVRGRAKAILEAAEATNAELKWSAAKEALLTGFDTLADRQAAMIRFKNAEFGPGMDPLTFAVYLRQELSRALPDLDRASAESIVIKKFVDAMPGQISTTLQLAAAERHLKLEQMADTVRTLQYFYERSLQYFYDQIEASESSTEKTSPAVCQAVSLVSESDQKDPAVASSSENQGVLAATEEEAEQEGEGEQDEEKSQEEQDAAEQDAEEQDAAEQDAEEQHAEVQHAEEQHAEEQHAEEQEPKEEKEQFYLGKEAQQTECLQIKEEFCPQDKDKEPEALKRQAYSLGFDTRRNCTKPRENKLCQRKHATLPSQGFEALLQKRIRFWKIYRRRKKKKPRKRLEGGRSVVTPTKSRVPMCGRMSDFTDVWF
ncbi:unnamed protein product [Calicophoron daubneyi]|uniref:Uncharacterized protein n=1 Tax=Calicophoron daubneyi TaxID=300641 RepID=A0AAV2SWD2_CALDB